MTQALLTFKVEGHKELAQVYSNLPKRTTAQVIRNGLKLAAKPIAQAAKMNLLTSSWNSEEASKSVKVRAMTRTRVTAGVTIGTSSEYWYAGQLFEYGFYDRPAEPWLRPAWDAESGRAMRNLTGNLVKSLDELAQRLKKQAYAGKLSREGMRALGL